MTGTAFLRARRGALLAGGLTLALIGAACSSATREVGSGASTAVSDSTGGTVPGTVRDPFPDVSAMEAIEFSQDPAGVPMSFTPPEGELAAVYFGYLSCPDICPLTMADLAAALNKLPPEDAARVTPAFVTVDPERDDGARLVSYMTHFFPEHPFRAYQAIDTGTLNRLAYEFHVQYSIPQHEDGEFYAVAHSGFVYLVDDRGLVVRELPFGTPSADTATAIAAELDAQDQREG